MTRSPGRILILALVAAASLPGAPLRAAPLDRHRYQRFPALEGKPVTQVLILGNNHTEEVVFRREMLLTEGTLFSSDDLWHDWERIVDLGIFAHVEVDAVPSGDGVLVVVSVFERPRWYVTPTADYNVDTKELALGYRMRIRNIRGLDQSVRSTAKGGTRDNFTLSWETPWVGDRRRQVRADLLVELPRDDPQDIRTNSIGISSTRFLGDFRKTRVGVTMFGRLNRLQREGLLPEERLDQLNPVIGVGTFRDTRDVRIDPARGTYAQASGSLSTGWTSDEISFFRTFLEGRLFQSVAGAAVVAVRGGTILTTGRVPDYRTLGVGGDDSIRGQPRDVQTGSNVGRASLEIRFPILAQRRFSLPIPFVPKRISNVDLRVDGELFADAGTAWNDAEGLADARVRSGFGVGLRVFLPVVELVRLELAFDESGKPSFLFSDGNVI